AARILKIAGPDTGATEEALGLMDRQIQAMSRMIDDLLDVARITQGKIQLRKAPVELTATIQHSVELSQPHIEARGQTLSLSLPPEPVYLDADAVRLDQVFGNLLNNASKFTPKGGHIWLKATVTRGERTEIVVRVRDDGAGIAPEVLPRVFDLFMQ